MIKQRGFSLIEALIALVVLSLGLIGMAGMQLKALNSATQAYQRSVATLAAVDAQERLWAALAQLPSGDDCSDIDPQDAVSPGDESIEDIWIEHWFDGSETPIRGSNGTISSLEGDCEFKIIIALDQVPDNTDGNFTYTFRLPEL
ncbi:type IV pilus modification protein PilV [Halomonas vilamensis]|uniref:Type IV pilus modification protein PilV n=1 Tax=Vreelandella vilamensis TaxID=531309 RepID=A0ABU1H511_9GAMM|nr:type IV pilus modification protein PilV [Halomonas vilamensis]MDR5899388.1 type IV pilus modification protein PilV [Halomonas vilamensis]